MNTFLRRTTLSVILVSIMVASTLTVMVTVPMAADENAAGKSGYGSGIDPALTEMMRKSNGPFDVYVIVDDRAAANAVLSSRGLAEINSREFAGIPTVSLMSLDKATIEALAGDGGAATIMAFERPMVEEARAELAGEDFAAAMVDPLPTDLDVNEVHGAVDAWDTGYDGEGVLLAVIDDGFDMAHPDLQGQQARYESGPYEGWPMAYDDYAAYQWKNGKISGWMADTTAEIRGKTKYASFDDVRYVVKGIKDIDNKIVSSKSGTMHIGYHPDPTLAALWGGPVAVLVVDTQVAGVYDTVYVDVMRDFDFTNDKPCTKGDEISYYDFYDANAGANSTVWNGGDGFADYSGGMAYWISDGANVYPASDWTYGAEFLAGPGDAVAFIGAYAGTHGTMTSSSAIATGVTMNGQLGGMAPGAKLITIPFTGSTVNAWLFAQFGVDGEPGTGDEATLVSNSYGWSNEAVEAGYTYLDMIAMTISMQGPTLWFWATGNGGPGYGTVTSVMDATSVHVGAGTTMQYRYLLGYEVIPEEQKWGDVIPFSNSGPGRNGKLNSEIIASGAYSLEPMPLNIVDELGSIGDGSAHLQVGSGTSHACPTVAGGAALGYQAYMLANGGAVPAKDYAKAVLMASADDMHFDAFKQGAGWLNAKTYVDAMGRSGGVMSLVDGEKSATSAFYPGAYDGEKYDMFPNFLLPGESSIQTATTSNFGSDAASVSISSELLLKTGSDIVTEKTMNKRDIFVDITDMVPESTDLLKVTMFMPYLKVDPQQDYVQDVEYWLEVHDWVDTNLNGVIGAKGIGSWELLRYTVDGSQCNVNQVMIKDPISRTEGQLVVRIRAIVPMMGIDISLQLDYYELQEFPWAELREAGQEEWQDALDLEIPADGQASWDLRVTVPEDAPVGSYAAAVYVDDGSRVQNMPIVINVPATDYEFEFGGESYFDTPYNNELTGVSDKWWRFEVGDWRMFWSLPSDIPEEDGYLLTSVSWDDDLTDINIHVFAPVAVDPEDEYEQVFSAPYGPGLYEMAVASSDERYMGAGIFGHFTNTGGTKEVIAAPLGAYENALGTPAPFAIAIRCPLIAGDEASESFQGETKWIVMNDYGPDLVEIEVDLSGDDPTSGTVGGYYDITLEGTIEAKGGGQDPVIEEQWDMEPVYQDAISSDFDSDLANAGYTKVINILAASILKVSVWEVENCPDIDLGLWQDTNMDGIATLDEPYWYVGVADSAESLTLRDLPGGQYLVKVLGYTVTGEPGYFGLSVMQGIEGASMTATDLETPVESGYYEFAIEWSVPEIPGTYIGAATFGFMGADDMFVIEVRVTVVE